MFPNQLWVIFLTPIKECHIVISAVGVSLQEELVELHQDELDDRDIFQMTTSAERITKVSHDVQSMQLTMSGSTVMSQEQLVPGGYFLSGQLGVMISPWDFVIFPPQNCWSETNHTHTKNNKHMKQVCFLS